MSNKTGDRNRSARRLKAPSLFVDMYAQTDNLGDSAIRAMCAQALSTDQPINALVRHAPPGYVSGLGLRTQDVVHTSRLRWTIRLLIPGTRRRVIPAGEASLSRSSKLRELSDLLLTAWIRATGGQSFQAFVGINPKQIDPSTLRLRRWTTRLCKMTIARDDFTAKLIHTDVSCPDIGLRFATWVGVSPSTSRANLAISIRADQDELHSDQAVALANLAERSGLTLITIDQVQRDAPAHSELAAHLGARPVTWTTDSHAGHAALLANEYRKSCLIVTNRLHVALFAASYGVIPVVLDPNEASKVTRHLSMLGYKPIGLSDLLTMPPEDFLRWATEESFAVSEACRRANRRVDLATQQLKSLVHAERLKN